MLALGALCPLCPCQAHLTQEIEKELKRKQRKLLSFPQKPIKVPVIYSEHTKLPLLEAFLHSTKATFNNTGKGGKKLKKKNHYKLTKNQGPSCRILFVMKQITQGYK